MFFISGQSNKYNKKNTKQNFTMFELILTYQTNKPFQFSRENSLPKKNESIK
jgi:hypothetical protein